MPEPVIRPEPAEPADILSVHTARLLREVREKSDGDGGPLGASAYLGSGGYEIALLAAGLLLATWTVAFLGAHRTFRRTRSTAKAKSAFLAVVDKGTIGLKAAMAGTPYA